VLHVARVLEQRGLRVGAPRARQRLEEGRQRDRGEDGQRRGDDQQLDEREATARVTDTARGVARRARAQDDLRGLANDVARRIRTAA